MTTAKKISFDINANALNRLDQVAKLADRPRSYVLNELVADFIDELEGYYIAAKRLKNTTESDYITISDAREILKKTKTSESSERGKSS